jgi:KDO2-lipid IV(A) lauroyltransferase
MHRSFIAHIPRRYIVNSGKLLGMLLFAIDAPHRRLVTRNLRFCYPKWSRDRIRKLRIGIFKHAGILILEILQSAFITREDLLTMFRVRGGENLTNALKGDKGVIIISAHLANWEIGFQFAGCHFGKPLTGIARTLRQEWLDRWFHHLRTRFGNRILYKRDALQEMRKTLRLGEIIALTLDQSRRKQAIEVTFMGKETFVTPAAALLAMRCKSPVLPMFCLREADYQLAIHIGSPLHMKRAGDLRADLRANTQIMMDALEDVIRRYPDQWVWYQRLWKVAYPQLYPEWEAKHHKRKKNSKKSKLSSRSLVLKPID